MICWIFSGPLHAFVKKYLTLAEFDARAVAGFFHPQVSL